MNQGNFEKPEYPNRGYETTMSEALLENITERSQVANSQL